MHSHNNNNDNNHQHHQHNNNNYQNNNNSSNQNNNNNNNNDNNHHHHDAEEEEEAWFPEDGAPRHLCTWAANMTIMFGFGLILLGIHILREKKMSKQITKILLKLLCFLRKQKIFSKKT
ncbi:unnamed protein product [Polarella glacialis]|uniref:Uncharacterized protein n=1 Tax=Polarella glacialis TaxID=89957 RepID=A0A813HY21_POLGL|nr:unnamed protein product [Polarella glacialis]CAE8661387.1 unnamed protein product [Polarella glacialis]